MSRLRTTASRGTVLVEGRSLPARARLEPRLHAYARHGSIRRPLVVRGPTPPAWGRLIPTSAPDRRDANLTRLLAAPDGEDRAAFEDARRRDVLPQVRVLTGGEWRTAGVLRDLPSLVRRDQAVPIDLRGVEGRTLRVRVDGPPGLWAIDRAVVAFDSGEPVRETRVLLSRAVGEHDEADRTALLRRADGRRHSLRPRTDSVLLAFDAPPERPGFHRTVLAEATGYYNVIVPADGDPQREALRRLIDEPGAVARFALERLPQRPVVAPR